MNIGPNVKKLVIYKLTKDAIPANGNVEDGIKFLLDKNLVNK